MKQKAIYRSHTVHNWKAKTDSSDEQRGLWADGIKKQFYEETEHGRRYMHSTSTDVILNYIIFTVLILLLIHQLEQNWGNII